MAKEDRIHAMPLKSFAGGAAAGVSARKGKPIHLSPDAFKEFEACGYVRAMTTAENASEQVDAERVSGKVAADAQSKAHKSEIRALNKAHQAEIDELKSDHVEALKDLQAQLTQAETNMNMLRANLPEKQGDLLDEPADPDAKPADGPATEPEKVAGTEDDGKSADELEKVVGTEGDGKPAVEPKEKSPVGIG